MYRPRTLLCAASPAKTARGVAQVLTLFLLAGRISCPRLYAALVRILIGTREGRDLGHQAAKLLPVSRCHIRLVAHGHPPVGHGGTAGSAARPRLAAAAPGPLLAMAAGAGSLPARSLVAKNDTGGPRRRNERSCDEPFFSGTAFSSRPVDCRRRVWRPWRDGRTDGQPLRGSRRPMHRAGRRTWLPWRAPVRSLALGQRGGQKEPMPPGLS